MVDEDRISISSERPSAAAAMTKALVGGDRFKCMCCFVSGNGVSLLTSAFLFALITAVQYGFAVSVGSVALQADCVSMGVDALAFLGNFFADCYPKESKQKRRIELGMSGISHVLLVVFTVQFLVGAIDDSQVTSDDDTKHERNKMGWTVFGFALGGLTFDVISLVAYKYYGDQPAGADDVGGADALTCGINTNMCAALLHVISDLARSTTTFVEGIVILNVHSLGATQADGISALIVCSIIAIGATGALLTWLREVYIYVSTPDEDDEADAGEETERGSINPVRTSEASFQGETRADSLSGRAENLAGGITAAVGEKFSCCCCTVSGNGVSLLTSAFLFALITAVQYGFAVQVGSVALQADCISMGVDALAFLGNFFADCFPRESDQKRRVELGMSGISHVLLLGFTFKFVFDGWDDAHIDDDGDDDDISRTQMGWTVLGFALGGLTFDVISLVAYKYYGDQPAGADAEGGADALTCGINTNMCAALLHIVSDLARSTTTCVEGVVILTVASISGTKADGVSALIVCSIIAIGASAALLTWLREVYIYVTSPSDGGGGGSARSASGADEPKYTVLGGEQDRVVNGAINGERA